MTVHSPNSAGPVSVDQDPSHWAIELSHSNGYVAQYKVVNFSVIQYRKT